MEYYAEPRNLVRMGQWPCGNWMAGETPANESGSVDMMIRKLRDTPIKNKHLLLVTALWILLVLYPNPLNLVQSLYRTLNPPVRPEAVQHMVAVVPQNPADLEQYVLETYPYQYDWVTYQMPWYFPTLEEALAQGTGDCKTRFIILASLFEAMEIPYQQSFSLSHFWLSYDGKAENSWEMEQNAFLVREEDGSVRLQVPREDRAQITGNFRDGFWHAMPGHRKNLLITGPFLTLSMGVMLHVLRRKGKIQRKEAAVDA